jgi:hypothetical protein
MKHLRKYNEDLSFLKELNRLLSEEDFNKYAEEFDSIIDGFVEYGNVYVRLGTGSRHVSVIPITPIKMQ